VPQKAGMKQWRVLINKRTNTGISGNFMLKNSFQNKEAINLNR